MLGIIEKIDAVPAAVQKLGASFARVHSKKRVIPGRAAGLGVGGTVTA